MSILKEKKILKGVFLLSLAVLIVSSALYFRSLADSYVEQRDFVRLAEEVGLSESVLAGMASDPAAVSSTVSAGSDAGIIYGEGVSVGSAVASAKVSHDSEIMSALAALKVLNPDFRAYIYIPGTSISYPVMKNAEEAGYYLHRDFYGQESNSGTPFLGDGIEIGDMSLVIYGHHMKSGNMFTDLTGYEDPSYREAHPEICLLTDSGIIRYEVIAAFRESLESDADPFYYYAYGGNLNEAQFEAFISGVRNMALYDTGFEVAYGNKIIMLSTCDYYTASARFVVVGRAL